MNSNTNNSSEAFEQLLRSLQSTQKLKAWSLIMTFFGDAIAPRGGVVAARTVQSILEKLGIEHGTIRTAFSRLASDGWLHRQKSGRHSYYSLSEQSVDEFEAASRIIYAPPYNAQVFAKRNQTTSAPKKNKYVIAVGSQSQNIAEHPFIHKALKLNNRCLLFDNACGLSKEQIEQDNYLVSTSSIENFPEWVRQLAFNTTLQQGYEKLQQQFTPVNKFHNLEALDQLAVRCLLIHEWRRLVLKDSPLDNPLQQYNTKRHACHALVAQLYQQLQTMPEQWLDQNAMGLHGALPPNRALLSTRLKPITTNTNE